MTQPTPEPTPKILGLPVVIDEKAKQPYLMTSGRYLVLLSRKRTLVP